MAYESIKVDLIPGAENAEVLHFSQFDNKRPFFIELFNGGIEFIPESGMSLSLECRKRDGNIVIISTYTLTDNVAEFSTTEQLTACYGDNTAEIKIVNSDDLVIGSANFIINVEKSPTCGGITSQTDIDNLEQQIAAIVPEVIGDDYYNKTETDALLADKADVSDLPDMSNYYNKTEADALLADKLNDYQLDDTPVLGAVSAAQIVSGWDIQHGYYKLIKNVALNTYSKSEIDTIIDNLFPTLTASGTIASFNTALNNPLVSVTADAAATTITRCGINMWNEQYEVGQYNPSNGQPMSASNAIRNKDYIIIPSGTSFALLFPNGISGRIFFFDINKTMVSTDGIGSGVTVKTMPNGCFYLRFHTSTSYGETYNNDISINYPSTDTSYHASDVQTVPVEDALTLKTLSGVNNVFADNGDVTVQYKYMSM